MFTLKFGFRLFAVLNIRSGTSEGHKSEQGTKYKLTIVSQKDIGIAWGFRFHVNISKTTKYRCHFSWYGGGSHYFDIFKVSRDNTPFGKVPICKECIWEVRKESRDGKSSICRINCNGYPHYCFGGTMNSL
ncbi:hypothetical protein YC2023_052467 [Brassica napus]